MRLNYAIAIAAALVLVAGVAAVGFFLITILQGTNVLLELIARSLEETP